MDEHDPHGKRSEARRLDARTRELDLLQELGRRTAEADDPSELFRTAADLLSRELELELLLAVVEEPGYRDEVLGYVARPLPPEGLDPVVGELVGAGRRVRCFDLDALDPGAEPRGRLAASDLLELPLERAGRPAGRVAVRLPGQQDEARQRLLYGAANQLSLHLDRILSGRERERDRFRAILDSMPQAVFLTDPGLRVVEANRAARAAAERLGVETGAAARLERIGDLDGRALAARLPDGEGAGLTEELRLGTDGVWTVTLSRVTSAAGGPPGLVWVLADVTESRALQQQLAQSEKMSSLGQMISGIAHELNNPLASILGYSQLLQAKVDDPKTAQRLGVLHTEATRCREIVRNLLSFARRHEPERKPLALNEVVESVIGLMRYQLRVNDVRLDTAYDRELPLIEGDAHQIQQILVNLFTNAQQAITEQGRGGQIRVATHPRPDGWVRLEVEDDGPGIPEALRGKVFDPFFSTKEVGQGTGLGLSLVYGIVTSHGGRIGVEAAPLGGARFVLDLPPGGASPAQASPEPPRPEREVEPGSILVVDDEAAVAALICEALAADGHRVHAVGDGRQALERLEHESFDLIVSDVKMPVMGGRQLYEEIESRAPTMARRMLLTSGDTVGGESEELARRAGLPLVHKPFDLDDLRRSVRSRLAGRGRRDRDGIV